MKGMAPQAGLVPSTARAVRRLKTAWGAVFRAKMAPQAGLEPATLTGGTRNISRALRAASQTLPAHTSLPVETGDFRPSSCVCACRPLLLFVALKGQEKGNVPDSTQVLRRLIASRLHRSGRAGSNRGRAITGTCSCGAALDDQSLREPLRPVPPRPPGTGRPQALLNYSLWA